MTSGEIYKFLKEHPTEFFSAGELAMRLNKSYHSTLKTILRLSGRIEKAYYKETVFVMNK